MTRFERAQKLIDLLPETWSPQAQQQLIDALEATVMSVAEGNSELERDMKFTMRKFRELWRFPDTELMRGGYIELRIKLAAIQATMRTHQ